MVSQRQVSQHNRATAHGAMRANVSASRNACTTSQSTVRPDVDVMANLHEVIELDAIGQHSIAQRATVYAGVRADFDIVTNFHRTELFDFFPLAVVRCKTETISTDHNTSMQDAALAHHTVFTNENAGFEQRVGTNTGTALNHAQWANAGLWINESAIVNHRTGMNTVAHRLSVLALPPLGKAGEVKVGLIRHDTGTACAGLFLEGGCHDDAGCLRSSEL